MQKIIWDESFSVGVKDLDGQHEQIINVINLLITSPDRSVRSEAISEALNRLTRYSKAHFHSEEAFLAEHHYPDLQAQKDSHVIFIRQVTKLCLETMAYRTDVPGALLTFLRQWWIDHILNEDMKYRAFLEST